MNQSSCLGGRLLRFICSDNGQTVIAMERSLRQKQSPCLGERLLRFASSEASQEMVSAGSNQRFDKISKALDPRNTVG